jgi:hypothetical protein
MVYTNVYGKELWSEARRIHPASAHLEQQEQFTGTTGSMEQWFQEQSKFFYGVFILNVPILLLLK